MMYKIMVVDDEEDFVEVIKITLEKEGYDVIPVYSGKECLEKLEEEVPDLILLDIMMPGMDGWEVCRRIKENEKTKKIIVVMVSVRAEEEDIKKSIEYAHADAHVNKLSSADIVDVVRKHLKEGESKAAEIF
jgi:CheY-like chemotaxis protein